MTEQTHMTVRTADDVRTKMAFLLVAIISAIALIYSFFYWLLAEHDMMKPCLAISAAFLLIAGTLVFIIECEHEKAKRMLKEAQINSKESRK